MKKDVLKKIVIALLSSALWVTSLYASVEDKPIRADLTLQEMEYEHVEYAEVEQLIKSASQILKTEDDALLYEWENTYYDLFCKVNKMKGIAELKYELDRSQISYFNEYLYCVDLLGKIQSEYIALFEDEETISSDVKKCYELTVEREKLMENYLALEETISVQVKNQSMTLAELLESEEIDDEQFMMLYKNWYDTYNQKAGEIFLEMVQIDNEIARVQGYENYIEYAYDSYKRDYSAQEIQCFIAGVKEMIPEVLANLYSDNKGAQSCLKSYSYEDEEILLQNINKNFISKYPSLQQAYDYMLQYQLYDIESREEKALGGFTIYLEQLLEPFIVVNYTYDYNTVLTLIHEFGHYYAYYTIGDSEGGLDLSETYSQALELLAMPYYEELLGSEQYSQAAEYYTVKSLLEAILEGCLYDEFLQEVYENPDMTIEEMNQLYGSLAMEYSIKVDERSWCFVTHNFEMPFYYISYSTSAVAALQIWEQSIREHTGIDSYLELVEVGKEQSFLESIEAVGMDSPITKEALGEIREMIEQYFEIGEQKAL